ncbi:MAG: cysteine desulfurase NifS [Chloroflexi bacterium]|nr:cysteine desulfurase NifS [Chloroflexota bacterium]
MSRPNKTIYMDHAATTPVDPRVVEAMLPYFTQKYGNASSIYALGREAHAAMEEARSRIAAILNADPKEIIFTSCGTESDNLAIRGVAWANRDKGNHIISSPIEHHAVGHTLEQLHKLWGYEITYVPVDRYGVVDPDDVGRAITDKTVLITIMYANNEIGTIEPIAEIAKVAQAKKIPFHTDAVQAGGALDLDVKKLGVDLMSLSAHKFYGPKGIGLLYAKRFTKLVPTQTGGSHERNRRAGTENIPYIVGMAKALELAQNAREEINRHVQALRDRLIQGVLSTIPDVLLTGHPTQRLPNSASFVFKGVEGESILLNLDLQGVAASSGSACTSASLEPSHVLLALGLPPEICHGSLRLTLGKDNTEADVEYVLSILPGIVEKLRAMSPVYQQMRSQ